MKSSFDRELRVFMEKQIAESAGERRKEADGSESACGNAIFARLAVRLQRPITPGQVNEMAGICAHTARRRLKELTRKRVFRPHGGVARIRSYELCAENERMFLWRHGESDNRMFAILGIGAEKRPIRILIIVIVFRNRLH